MNRSFRIEIGRSQPIWRQLFVRLGKGIACYMSIGLVVWIVAAIAATGVPAGVEGDTTLAGSLIFFVLGWPLVVVLLMAH